MVILIEVSQFGFLQKLVQRDFRKTTKQGKR